MNEETHEKHHEDQAFFIAVRRGGLGNSRDDALDALFGGERNVLDDPLHEAREPEDGQENGDHAESQGNGNRGDQRCVLAEDRHAEGQCDQVGEENSGDAQNFLQNRTRRDFDSAPAQTRGVVEFVAVQTRGAGKKESDGATDQKGAQDMPKTQFDFLTEKHQLPAVHGRENSEKTNPGPDGGKGPEDRGVDGVELVQDQIPRGNPVPRAVGHGPEQE